MDNLILIQCIILTIINNYYRQLYIDKPLLYNKRKFDIRCFIMLTSINGILKAYWYEEVYIKTSSQYYNI